jgi:hypothetical protein
LSRALSTFQAFSQIPEVDMDKEIPVLSCLIKKGGSEELVALTDKLVKTVEAKLGCILSTSSYQKNEH